MHDQGKLQVRITLEAIRVKKGRVRRVTTRKRGPYDLLTESAAASMAVEDTMRELVRTYTGRDQP